MILNQIKLDRADIFIKYIPSVFPLVFPPKILISNKLVLPVSNLLKALELVENKVDKTFSKNI